MEDVDGRRVRVRCIGPPLSEDVDTGHGGGDDGHGTRKV
jgi:hypothetical protein